MGKVKVKITESQMNYLFENSRIDYLKNQFGVISNTEFEELSKAERTKGRGRKPKDVTPSDVEGTETPKEKNYTLTPIKTPEGGLIALILTDEKGKSKVRISEETFNNIVNADPTNNKIYVQWLLKILIEFIKHKDFEEAARFVDEDLPQLSQTLVVFDEVKNLNKFKTYAANEPGLPSNPSNILSYTSITQLYLAIEPYIEKSDASDLEKALNKFIKLKEAKIVYEDSKWLVYEPLTREANCALPNPGLVKFCTANPGNSYFQRYTSEGGNLGPGGEKSRIYDIINKKVLTGESGEVYQFHFESEQWKDASNGPNINLVNFFSANPGLGQFFSDILKDLAKRLNVNDLERNKYLRILSQIGEIDNILEYFDVDSESIDLKSYRLKNLSSDISNFKNLYSLSLNNAGLKSFPNEITKLSNLAILFAPNNNIKELPKDFGDLKELHVLNLEGNPLKELPESISKLNGNFLKIKLPKEMSEEAKSRATKLLSKTTITWV
jgi:Leucine-rich repeat (LRR) protein